jgi:hypothetical protein
VAVIWLVDLDLLLDESLLGKAAAARLQAAYRVQRAQWERVAAFGTSVAGKARAATAADGQEREAFNQLEQLRSTERHTLLSAVRDVVAALAPPDVVVVDRRAVIHATTAAAVDATPQILAALDGSFLASGQA